MESCEIPRWAQLKASLSNLDGEAFIQLYQSDPSGICLDVRTKEEYDTGHLEGARHLDYLSSTLADELEALDPEPTYYICCRTGRRSVRVAVLLRNMGVKVFNLDDGLRKVDVSYLV
jgi:rhodanese-related sulfurtransferase